MFHSVIFLSLLTTKFKYEQQKPSNVVEVQACRKKFTSKRHSVVNTDDDDDGSII